MEGNVAGQPEAAPPGPPAPSVTGMSGTLDVKITTSDQTLYDLSVTIPTGTGGAKGFSLTETPHGGTLTTLASVSYTSDTDFSVQVDMPPISAGGTTIDGGFTLKEGGS